jgi:hypothetical protein
MTLSPGTTNVKEMPRHSLAVNVNVENMLSNTHSLDACMKNIVYEEVSTKKSAGRKHAPVDGT